MGQSYDHAGYSREIKVKNLEIRIDKLVDSMTLDNQADVLRKIGSLQIKIAALCKVTMTNIAAMDWGVRVSE